VAREKQAASAADATEAPPASEPVAEAPPAAEPAESEAAALTADERTELEQLRAEHEARLAAEQAESGATPPEVGQPPTSASAVAEAGPEEDELPYGTHACPECGAMVAVQYPGYADPEARSREAICPNGHRFFPSGKTRARAR
jgi:hypothetical protein